MKANRALALMAALVITTLVVSAFARQEDGAPRPRTYPTPSPDLSAPNPGAGATSYVTSTPAQVHYVPSQDSRTLYFQGGNGAAITWATTQEDAGLEDEAGQLIKQLGEAKSDGDRDKVRTKLGEILEKQFDRRQKRHEKEIEELEAQVRKLRDLVQKRQDNRREIIARRLDQILKESQGLGW
jgi:hypothetical protein